MGVKSVVGVVKSSDYDSLSSPSSVPAGRSICVSHPPRSGECALPKSGQEHPSTCGCRWCVDVEEPLTSLPHSSGSGRSPFRVLRRHRTYLLSVPLGYVCRPSTVRGVGFTRLSYRPVPVSVYDPTTLTSYTYTDVYILIHTVYILMPTHSDPDVP